MKTLLCCIGRLENAYIREYVEYYKNLGFTNICLYDNNHEDEEHFEEVIGDYIESGFVILKNYRGRTTCQLDAYNECYAEYGKEYDWIAFFDCDEFLTLKKNNTIDQYLSRMLFKNAQMIHVNWMNMNDSDNIYYENKPVLERFKKHCPYDYKCEYQIPEDYHTKSIIRGGLDSVVWHGNPHTPSNGGQLKTCGGSGQKADGASPFVPYDFSNAYIRHFTTKTIEEYCNKMKRGFPDQPLDYHMKRVEMLLETRFFKTNDITKEKIEVAKKILGIDMGRLIGEPTETKTVTPKEGKNEDVKIFSLCYAKKDFEFLNDSVITPLQVGAANGTDVCELKDNTGQNISSANFFYIENTGTYWIWQNVHNCKYKGQMQYRRPLEGIDETFDFDEAFKHYDAITCIPFNHPSNNKPTKENNYTCIPANTVEGGYKFSNNGKDIEILEEVIKESFPEYAESYNKYIKNGENLYYSSGFILREADYDRYCSFLFNVLNKWLEKAKIGSQLDLYYYLGVCAGQGYLKQKLGENPLEYPKTGVRWETSIGGFLGERLWTLWLLHNYTTDRILTKPYVKMEEGMYT